jgi:peptide/nickel transport system permease protein
VWGWSGGSAPPHQTVSLGLFVAQRLVVLVPTLFFVSVLIFSLQQLLPGDAAIALAGEEQDPAVVTAIREKYHLDRPMVVQYGIWMGRVLRGDFGESLRNKIPVSELLASKLPVTVELALFSMIIALVLGIPAGVLSAARKGTPIDVVANIVALSGLSVPHFWLGIMLILLFAVQLGWLPASGYVPPWEDWRRNLTTILMPAFVLGTGVAGVMMRHTRGAMLQTLSADYVRTARAKSVPERLVVLKHALRNALIPVITLGAIEFGRLLSGAVLTEQIFAIPGFGKMLVDGVFNRDYAVVQAVVLVSATLFVLLNLLADVLYFLANPRLRG